MMIEQILDFLYPPFCLLCKEPLTKDTSILNKLLQSHVLALKLFCFNCSPMFQPLVEANQSLLEKHWDNENYSTNFCSTCRERSILLSSLDRRCLPCILSPLPSNSIKSVWHYTGIIENCIKALKYANQLILAQFFALVLYDYLILSAIKLDWDLIIPLPSSPHMVRTRGFSPVVMVAKHLSKKLQIPLKLFALRSNKIRRPQTLVPLQNRYTNLFHAFKAKSKVVSGKKILLLDDVLTTGSSISSASSTLLQAGALKVDVLTIARSTNFKILRMVATSKQQAKINFLHLT